MAEWQLPKISFPKVTLKGGVPGKIAAVTITYISGVVTIALFCRDRVIAVAAFAILTGIAGMVLHRKQKFVDKYPIESLMDGAELVKTYENMGSKSKRVIKVTGVKAVPARPITISEQDALESDSDSPKRIE